MADATAKLSELLSAAGGCRTLDDALGSPRREPSFLDKASDGSSSDPDSGQSPELSASMRLVRSYAARVKQMPPWLPEPATFGGRRRQSLPVSREEWLEPSRSTLRPTYFSPERVPNVLIKSAEARLTRLTRLINEDIPLLRTRSDESRPLRRLSTGAISTVLHGCPPAAQGGLQCRFLALIPAGEDADTADKADKTVTRAITDVAPSASRHWAVQRRKSSTDISSTGSNSANSSNSSNSFTSIYAWDRTLLRAAPQREPLACLIPALPAVPSSGKRFHVRLGMRSQEGHLDLRPGTGVPRS
ncbi:hypothetical protein T484DRAFT_2519127 [Baffinella frigidus]|nr:hypothetical protein T484DRAFT_2519127 [Cryptophyta sp. CCMP2293]